MRRGLSRTEGTWIGFLPGHGYLHWDDGRESGGRAPLPPLDSGYRESTRIRFLGALYSRVSCTNVNVRAKHKTGNHTRPCTSYLAGDPSPRPAPIAPPLQLFSN